ncbi:MAG: iron uptake porin [Jaaginema sp. PMC 1079.18]|nr:iron uptake porin [Jaaginema sp. PMC 1080.18]MEC4852593.1 iron uptake porin [Jaaginema sp. PMC 1079.18]MEC4868341.1 iron uptake porin [Jaaginema sp. PMC 1078.18]
MFKLLWKLQAVSPAALIATLVASSGAIAAENPVSIDTALTEAAQAQVTEIKTEVKTNDDIALAGVKADEAKTLDVAVSNEAVTPVQPSLEVAPPETLNFDTAAELPVGEIAQTPSDAEILQEVNRYSNEGGNSLNQSVQGASKFRDVSPNDWAFQALDDLIRRYDCLVGYPNGTFRGNRPLTRYEFAAGLNACLNQIERLIASATADFVTRDDLETLRRLLAEFEAELATLGTRVDNLEARTAFLEDNQFSTTTKLTGEVIFALTSDFTDTNSVNGVVQGVDNAIFGDRVRLTLNTSFSGRDRLVTRLAAGNLSAFNYGSLPFNGAGTNANTRTSEGYQTFNLFPGSGNDVQIDWLAYYFPFEGINSLGVDNSYVYIAANGGIWSDIAPTTNPYFEDYDGGNGALSTFASENPIFRIGGGAGAAISFGFSPIESILGPSTVTLGYLAGEHPNPGQGSGLFNGDYAALGQVNFNLFDYFAVGLTYVHGYHGTGSAIYGGGTTSTGIVGSYLANNPWGVLNNGGVLAGTTVGGSGATVTNSYGAQIAFRPTDWLSVSGFATKTDATLIQRGDADIWSYGLGLALPDLGKEGNLLGFFAGIQPSLRGLQTNGLDRTQFRLDDGWHLEGFYKYQVSDNISITPGVIWLTRPNQNNNSNPAVIGTLRTTFTF